MIKKRSKKLIMLVATLVATSITFVSHTRARKVSLQHGQEILNDINTLFADLEALDNPNALDGVTLDVSSLHNAVNVVEKSIKKTVSTAQALL